MSQLSGQCGILNISQLYRPPRPVTGIALLYWSSVNPALYGAWIELLQLLKLNHYAEGWY
jgi:hypothetical protein